MITYIEVVLKVEYDDVVFNDDDLHEYAVEALKGIDIIQLPDPVKGGMIRATVVDIDSVWVKGEIL